MGWSRVWALLALTLLWAALDHQLKRDDGRWYALATLWAALDQLFTGALLQRSPADPAFLGSWALALVGNRRGDGGARREVSGGLSVASGTAPLVRGALWALGGAMVLFGVTGEIDALLRAEAAVLARTRALPRGWPSAPGG